ncbi:hypothetical protein [Dactylosporangium salmoneum]|uniref:hypothetical protein n=1 Tax=Dactylosporangium salmoneum TaxID=53361 RepID=UPI0031E37FB0
MSRFPSKPLVVQFLVYWGADLTADPSTWTATDLTDRWNTAVELKVTEGRSEGAKQAETTECTFSLFNTDGQLTPEDARSQWWPYVDAGTPCMWIVDAGEGEHELFAGYFSAIKPTWPGRSRHLSLIEVRATGVLERIGRGDSPLRPALARAVMADNPAAYWQLNDDRNATQAANAVPGGSPMVIDDRGVGFTMNWSEVEGPVGAVRYPELITDDGYGAQLVGTVPDPAAPASFWQVEWWWSGNGDPTPDVCFALPIAIDVTGSTVVHVDVPTQKNNGITGGSVLARLKDATGSAIALIGSASDGLTPLNDRWHYARLALTQTAPTTFTAALYYDGALFDRATGLSGKIGWPKTIRVHGFEPVNSGLGPPINLSVAQVVVSTVDRDHYQAGIGYAGETASDRILRLCLEEAIPCTVDAGNSARMGPQLEATLQELLAEAEATDLGRLTERHFGVHYRPAETLLNQAAAFTIDASRRELREPFEPVRDLQRIRNEWTLKRTGGSEATYRDAASQRQRGKIGDSADISPELDSTLIHEAAWRTQISMAPGMRMPGIGINLARSPRLIAPWQQLQLGDRVQAVNLLPQHPPGPLDQILEGRTQVIKGRRVWRAALITSPAAPYTVGVIEDDQLGRLDAGDTDRLAAPVAAGALQLPVMYDDGTLWSEDPVEFPIHVEVGGEQIEVVSITPTAGDAFNRTVPSGWGTPDSGQTWTTTGGNASDYYVQGV